MRQYYKVGKETHIVQSKKELLDYVKHELEARPFLKGAARKAYKQQLMRRVKERLEEQRKGMV